MLDPEKRHTLCVEDAVITLITKAREFAQAAVTENQLSLDLILGKKILRNNFFYYIIFPFYVS